ncbi:hypothetical protein SAMN02745172_00099 [Pseudoxanthobacter soli DSM 19599]|uniref:Peptidase S53 domain-containing protein n=1 Tax=Pseudoxanthobacter soli DSM 19599 TaxID=1123029 RepID=A0A1M7Z4L5_9HYPH|nr:DUF4114 domain-containing protein [Pseudoxanthobacter soli]SHO59883.1 hypothetical protein SAMN02745172_00099 [Pseudoxanthobacter soli DSM 19599]
MSEIAHSSFLDFTGYQLTNVTDVPTAYGYTPSQAFAAPAGSTINVALVLNRASDPSSLLSLDWGDRQKTLASLNASNSLWTTYGTDPTVYNDTKQSLTNAGYTVIGDSAASDGYISSAASRTIWLSLSAAQFGTLFGTPLMAASTDSHAQTDPSKVQLLYWNGNLSLSDQLNSVVSSLWVDEGTSPIAETLLGGSTALNPGSQSVGNGATTSGQVSLFPQDVAALYNFPLANISTQTGTVGLVEPGIGSALPSSSTQTFQQLLDAYRNSAGITTSGSYYTVANAGQTHAQEGERSLDVGVVTAINPSSTFGLYAGAGPNGTVFTAYQGAIWDTGHDLSTISSSWNDDNMPSPDSPFLKAYRELFVDAALRNVTVFTDAFDGGSSNENGTGLASLAATNMSPFNVTVGGTSISTNSAAATDVSLNEIVAAAAAHDLGTLKVLIAGGLTTLPGSDSLSAKLVEAVWNQYYYTPNSDGNGGTLWPTYLENFATSGGVDTTQGIPHYQLDSGIFPTSVNPGAELGRGVPDVSALAGGNMYYITPFGDMAGLDQYGGGTSAATPLWASLTTQIDAIFADQGLPQLGYMNDLLYTAAIVAPGSFNDVMLGNNISTFTYGGNVEASYDGTLYNITPTGHGYYATPGYDLTTGLGSPNGVLLARALSSIAHTQMWFDTPEVLSGHSGDSTLTSTLSQSLLVQPIMSADSTISLNTSGGTTAFNASGSSAYAWTSQFAQQALQSDFTPSLVTMFDGQSQSAPTQISLGANWSLSVGIGGGQSTAPQASLSSPYGFVDYVGASGRDAVEVARPVAVAETAGGADNQDAVVRIRQSGVNDVGLTLYKVDDYSGTINGVAPGAQGYAAAADSRAYHTVTGATMIDGPGFGDYAQTQITGVNAGDLVAMKLSVGDNTYWAFSQANETVNDQNVTHLWNYGLNTWGWEDLYGGGDHDYNDLVVQLDFTSASGHGWLV